MTDTPPMELRNFQISNNGTNIIGYGTIYNDTRGRFADGQHVHTSYITEIDFDGLIVKTRNSTYKVDGFRGGILIKFLNGEKQA